MFLDDLSKKRLIKMGVSLFISYLSVAMALPVISVYVCHDLGYAHRFGGLAVGISFFSTILSRKYAGFFSDTVSPKKCTMRGLFLYISSAAICLVSALAIFPANIAYIILIVGRLILGFGESMVMVGLTSWHFAVIGPKHSGKILSVAGMAMYGAFALGGPLGLAVYSKFDFKILMGLSIILPFIGGLFLFNLADHRNKERLHKNQSFFKIIHKIWKQGMVVSLQGVGFAVLGAFVLLYFKSKGWPFAGMGLSLFGIGFVLSRIFWGSIPDRFGGINITCFSLVVELIGQLLLWMGSNLPLALIGSFFTGLGCSMIFPAMGVEAIKRVHSEYRATAFGGFAAFQDLSYAVSAPIAGVLVDFFDYSIVFLMGAMAAALGILFILSIYWEEKVENKFLGQRG